jgi:hypothetical protein
MRALCGSIIAAGALIGLGLTALGIGNRYAYFAYRNPGSDEFLWLKLRDLDTPLMMILIVLLACVVIGLVTAFIGLMYHHHRRHHEHMMHSAGGSLTRSEDRPRVSV